MYISRKRSNIPALVYIDEKAEKHSSGLYLLMLALILACRIGTNLIF
jgi:hypothetical protein